MKVLKLATLLVFLGKWAVSQTPLPTAPPQSISIQQIKTYMHAVGQLSDYDYYTNPNLTLRRLNELSFLTDKTEPFSLSDWYGYTSTMGRARIHEGIGLDDVYFEIKDLSFQPYNVAVDITIDFYYLVMMSGSYVALPGSLTIYSGNSYGSSGSLGNGPVYGVTITYINPVTDGYRSLEVP